MFLATVERTTSFTPCHTWNESMQSLLDSEQINLSCTSFIAHMIVTLLMINWIVIIRWFYLPVVFSVFFSHSHVRDLTSIRWFVALFSFNSQQIRFVAVFSAKESSWNGNYSKTANSSWLAIACSFTHNPQMKQLNNKINAIQSHINPLMIYQAYSI